MDSTVIAASVSGCITMVVTTVVNYSIARLKADQWMSQKFDTLVDDLRKRLTAVEQENRECQEKYRELSEILRFITPVHGPAE